MVYAIARPKNTALDLVPSYLVLAAAALILLVFVSRHHAAQAASARVAASWPDDITLAVNVSPMQIRAPGAVRCTCS